MKSQLGQGERDAEGQGGGEPHVTHGVLSVREKQGLKMLPRCVAWRRQWGSLYPKRESRDRASQGKGRGPLGATLQQKCQGSSRVPKMVLMQERERDADGENEPVDAVGEGQGRMN